MQLKLKRSLKESGLLTKTTVFCLDARATFTQEQAANISKYKLGGQVIYTSEKAKEYAASSVNTQGTVGGAAKAWANFAMSKLALTVTVNGLVEGKHIECKDLGELLEAEGAIYQACENLKQYLDVAKTFDGRETIIDFAGEKPELANKNQTLSLEAIPSPPPTPTGNNTPRPDSEILSQFYKS
jgi:hypothetical protein